MNTPIRYIKAGPSLVGAAVAAALLAGCASTPPTSPAVAEVRSRLTALQADPDLAPRAPVAIREADVAVRAAETAQTDKVLAAHTVFMADRKVESARALAEAGLVEQQRTALTQERERARLDARTREADAARSQALIAQSEGEAQRRAAEQARGDADAAQVSADSAQRENAALQQRLDELQAEVTDRGIVLTLGDMLFTTGRADLKAGTTANLDRLVSFLGEYPDRMVAIEGHTDSVGSESTNQTLSEQRAQAVKTYLVTKGVSTGRLAAVGKGEGTPVTENDTAPGRQQNRRVEVIISNTVTASR